MVHDDRRETVEPNQSLRFSSFFIEPIEPRMMLAFAGVMDFAALHFHGYETVFAGYASFATPVRVCRV